MYHTDLKKVNYISTFLLFLLTINLVNGQVVIGDGLTISEGTTMRIINQDVTINSDQIAGGGSLVIESDTTQNIYIAKDLKTDIDVNIQSRDININGAGKIYFALHHLPSLSDEIIAAKKKEEQKHLPVKYINFEGKTFKVESDEDSNTQKLDTAINLMDIPSPWILVDSIQIKGATINLDYIIPIYSFLLNNERFSDYAELYEFKCLTALLKPPIA
ncbi:MAG: hypothetical protein ACR2MS_08500 [Weeksellaceae bacterium]